MELVKKDVVGDLFLACPKCGHDYVHMTKVTVHRKNDLTEITNEGIKVTENKNTSRGVRVTIRYDCEYGHVGNIVLYFHKGMTYFEHEELPETERLPDIWRD